MDTAGLPVRPFSCRASFSLLLRAATLSGTLLFLSGKGGASMPPYLFAEPRPAALCDQDVEIFRCTAIMTSGPYNYDEHTCSHVTVAILAQGIHRAQALRLPFLGLHNYTSAEQHYFCFRRVAFFAGAAVLILVLVVFFLLGGTLLLLWYLLRNWSTALETSQRSLHNEPIFRLLLKVAVKGVSQCEFRIFSRTFWVHLSLGPKSK